MKHDRCKLLIIGAGPGGYICGMRAAQLGVDTIVVEEKQPGGTCLNVGCIPSKALIHAGDEFSKAKRFSNENELGISASVPKINFSKTIAWKNGIVKRLSGGVLGLLKKANTRYIQGSAKVVDGKTIDVTTDDDVIRIVCEHLVIATGSKPIELPFLPFAGNVISSTEALDLNVVPKRLTIVGAGYIGLEIGTAMVKLGSTVTIVEGADRILPQYDRELSAPVLERLKSLGANVHMSSEAKGLSEDGTALLVNTLEGESIFPSDKILVTVGRTPATIGFGLEELGLTMNGSFIAVNEYCATSMRNVYAIGDVTGDPMLAHRAMAQGTLVAEYVAGQKVIWDKRAIPEVCFTDPEIVTVGALPNEIDGSKTSVFPFTANGRSMTVERSNGFVRVVHDRNEVVLGIQAVGAGVSEMAGEFSLAIEMAATLTDIGNTIHAHPTLGEAVQETALKALGRALHI